MPMTQADILAHYREHWDEVGRRAADEGDEALGYSSPIEDAVTYPIYERLIRDMGIRVDGGRVLDIGCGAGRWTRFFLDRFSPASITGVDFAEASVAMLGEWSRSVATSVDLRFETGDITEQPCPIDGRYDLINVGNVLFHVPEPDKFGRALSNIAGLLGDGGRAVTTEYLPRMTMRTEWMLVRSRYEFEAACTAAGLEIVDVRPACFFANDPMGLDGPSEGTRKRFNAVRALTNQLLGSAGSNDSRRFITGLFAEIESACLEFCRERVAPIDMPSQKLVVLRAE